MANRISSWHNIPWKLFFITLKQMQDEIVKAEMNGNRNKVYKLQRKLVCSIEGRAITVRNTTTSNGGKTPGIDGIVWDSPKKRMDAIVELQKIVQFPKRYVASPVRRVIIPKPGSEEKRPLGIPTMIDRAVQGLYLLAVDPVVECTSDIHSYGFRVYKSAHDAIAWIRNLLDKPHAPKYILETDVEKCFDRISHDFLLKHTPICDKNVLEQWLQSGAHIAGKYEPTMRGTPQGGVISPLLCNIALNGMEEAIGNLTGLFVKTEQLLSIKLHVIRYADDLIITCDDKTFLETKVMETLSTFLAERDLNMKEGKTRIVSINTGFEFLGFSFKRVLINLQRNRHNPIQETVLLVRPSRKNIQRLTNRIKTLIVPEKPLPSIVRDLNPVLKGWSEYFRISYPAVTVCWKMGHFVWGKMWTWARKRHPRRNGKYLYARYVHAAKGRKWNFGDENIGYIFDISSVKENRKPFLKGGLNPYLLENREYYEKRRKEKIYATFRASLYALNKHKCPECGESLHNGEEIELHHIKPIKDGGDWSLKNVVPLHRICHQQITYKTKGENQTE